MPRKLLLADDSVTIQRVIELTFAGEDVQVIAVGDGEQAINRIPSERPDIVLADIGMPKRSGYEVAAFVKGNSELRHIPVLLLAGAFEPVDDAKAEQAGSDGVLVKPFEPQHVIARVRELLDGAKGNPTRQATATVTRAAERFTAAPKPAEIPERPVQSPASRDQSPESRDQSSESRDQRPETKVQSPETSAPPPAPAPAAAPDDSLDDYFERLDAAFATMGNSPASLSLDAGDTDLKLPTLDDVLSRVEEPPPAALPPSIRTPVTPAPVIPMPNLQTRPVPEPVPVSGADVTPAPGDDHSHTVLADAFAALLAVEAGEPGAHKVRLRTAAAEPQITDALVDEVARRVIARLAPDAARAVVVQVVSEIAERLIREEIARIRSK